MPKCKEVKNACKICFSPVKPKTGLQCQGACRTWVHYACLNYTPGKIQDIKKGIIKIVCPCPDCKTKLVKEYRSDLYACDNSGCPANKLPSCTNKNCTVYREMSKQNIPVDCGSKNCRQTLQFPAVRVYSKTNNVSSSSSESVSAKKPSARRNAMSEPSDQPLQTVEHICKTVCQLAKQLNELAAKLEGVSDGNGNTPPYQAPRQFCP